MQKVDDLEAQPVAEEGGARGTSLTKKIGVADLNAMPGMGASDPCKRKVRKLAGSVPTTIPLFFLTGLNPGFSIHASALGRLSDPIEGLMELVIGAAVALLALASLLAFAPRLGGPTAEARSKGLSALQTIFALAGIVLIAEWYLVEQPDAARLKFEQSVTGAPLGQSQALVMIEVSITNVGGHSDHFDRLPYKIFVQQVTPLPDALKSFTDPPPEGSGRVWRADNWGTLAYRAVGSVATKAYPNWDACKPGQTAQDCDSGLETTIGPGENENLYYAAAVPCAEGLHVSVSSRFQRPHARWGRLLRREPEVWIKQSFLDLTEACKSEAPIKGAH